MSAENIISKHAKKVDLVALIEDIRQVENRSELKKLFDKWHGQYNRIKALRQSLDWLENEKVFNI